MRTPQQILEQTNKLARTFAGRSGWQTAVDFKFYETTPKTKNPRKPKESDDTEIYLTARMENFKISGRAAYFWDLACAAQEIITGTDITDVLEELGLE